MSYLSTQGYGGDGRCLAAAGFAGCFQRGVPKPSKYPFVVQDHVREVITGLDEREIIAQTAIRDISVSSDNRNIVVLTHDTEINSQDDIRVLTVDVRPDYIVIPQIEPIREIGVADVTRVITVQSSLNRHVTIQYSDREILPESEDERVIVSPPDRDIIVEG